MMVWILSLALAAEANCGKSAPGMLDLRGCWVTDSDLPALAKTPGLKRLDLSMTRITDEGMSQLKPLASLEDLNLRYAELLTDEGLSAVKSFLKLKRLDLRGTKATDTTLGYLTGLTSLEWLDVGFAQISDSGLEQLAGLSQLKTLRIGGNKLTDLGLASLRLMPQLEELDLSGPQRTDSGLWSVSLTAVGVESIGTLTKLRELKIGGTAITSGGLDRLRRALPSLERLSLQRAKRIGDEAGTLLLGWKSLKEIDLRDTPISAAALEKLKAGRPDCQIRH
ncbi:MAG: leucine-rich repeat domain-containing protein [Acidobacteriota bacterium]